MIQGSKKIWDTRPVFNKPSLPQFATPIPDRADKCGAYWGRIEVRYPYKHTDIFLEVLPKLDLPEREDLGNRGNALDASIANRWVEKRMISVIIDQAYDLYKKYSDIIGKANSNAVKKHIETAVRYVNEATALWSWWKYVYVPVRTPLNADVYNAHHNAYYATSLVSPHWPLSSDVYAGRCIQGFPYPSTEKVEIFGKKFIVNCPEDYEFVEHNNDAWMYGSLVIAAIVHSRCAAEAAAAVGVYMVNKAKSRARDKKPSFKWGGV